MYLFLVLDMDTWCKSVKKKQLKGATLVETLVTMLLVVLFFTTSYVVLVKVVNFALDVIEPMPVYLMLTTKMNTIKADIDNSLVFKVNANQIYYILKNGQQGFYDFGQFRQWFSQKYQASATVVQMQPDSAVVTWQFTTSRKLKLYGTTVLKKVTQAVPVPKEIISITGGVVINLYNPAVGISSTLSPSAQVTIRYPDATEAIVNASLINNANIDGQNVYYGVFVPTATKPVSVLLPSLYGFDGSHTYPVEVAVP